MVQRVAIIGQSNAILHTGFAAHLKQQPNIAIGAMGRLGASPSVILPYFASPEWLAGHDVCIIDVAVSDSVYLWTEAIDPVAIGEYLTATIRAAHSVGCLPLILIIPHRSMVPDPAAMPLPVPMLHQIYHAVAAREGAMLLDLTRMLHALARRAPEMLDQAYDDANHLSDAFSRQVAARLATLIEQASATPIRRLPTSAAVPNFATVSVTALAPEAPTTRRESSLYAQDFVTLGAGDRLVLSIGAFDRLHGIMLNRSQSAARVSIEGSGTIVKALGTSTEREHALVAQLCPVLGPMRDQDGKLALTIADAATPVTEPSWNPFDAPAPRLEIAEILVQRGWRTLDYGWPVLPPALADASLLA